MTKLVVPPMPSPAHLAITTDNFGRIALARIIDHDQEGWQTAQLESALADELAEALEGIESIFDKVEKGFDYPAEVRFAARDAARCAIQSHKEPAMGETNHDEIIREALRKLARNENSDDRTGSTELAGDAFEALNALRAQLSS